MTNEPRTVTLAADDGRTVEGRVHVRGIDRLAGGRGVLFERHRPVAIVVREGGEERELPIEPRSSTTPLLPFIVAPAVALLIRGIVRSKGRRNGHHGNG